MPLQHIAPVWQETRGFLDEFKAFIRRGNVIDLAVGVILGAAFTKIVNSLVGDILMPSIGYALGNVDVKDLTVTLPPAIVLSYGRFLQAIIDFVIIGFCVFLLVKVVNRLHGRSEEPPKAPSDDVKLLMEIRDLLKGQSTSAPGPTP
jgi:large conductance mechanosensitive channel